MRIARIEDFHVDGGWRTFSMLKITTDTGIEGWSEFSEMGWAPGVTGVIRRAADACIGEDPRTYRVLVARLAATTRMVAGGTMQQAIGAIENALLDICAKNLGVPVHALLGGKFRDTIPLYWSHFGTVRAAMPGTFERFGDPRPMRTLDDLSELARQAANEGWRGIKTNALVFENGQPPRWWSTGLSARSLVWNGHCERPTVAALAAQIDALRAGFGQDGEIMLDLSFGMASESIVRLDEAADDRLAWLEIDKLDPSVLADLRRRIRSPIASLEAVYTLRGYRPFFEARAADVAIVDVLWNGVAESVRIASLADTFDLTVAPHNFYGPLGDAMSAHFAAAVPNCRTMEYERDDVPWKYEFVPDAPRPCAGMLIVPDGPGWGVNVDEDALRRYRKDYP